MLTIAPLPAATMPGTSARDRKKGVLRFSPIVSSQLSTEMSSAGCRRLMPAAWTTLRIAPNGLATRAARPSQSSTARRSASSAAARPPSASTSATSASSDARRRARHTTGAPARANAPASW